MNERLPDQGEFLAMENFLQSLQPDFLVLFGLWILAVLYLVKLTRSLYKRVYRYHWYDRSDKGANEEMEWCQIRSMIKNDPLKFQKTSKKLCRCPCKLILFDSIRSISLLFIVFGSLIFIFYWTLSDDIFCWPVLNECFHSKKTSQPGNLNLAVAIVAGATTLIGTLITVFYHIRLQARSKNRQNWIISIRKEMTVLMTNFPTYDASESEIEIAQQETRANITRLSLYLNPAERVHRGFLAIVRFMYRIDGLEEDEMPRKKLGVPESPLHEQQKECEPQDTCKQQEAWSMWNSKTMRLANILLKREWEQVKYVK